VSKRSEPSKKNDQYKPGVEENRERQRYGEWQAICIKNASLPVEPVVIRKSDAIKKQLIVMADLSKLESNQKSITRWYLERDYKSYQ
jgi:SepF-like predicted cell division protein (DUF552 family)